LGVCLGIHGEVVRRGVISVLICVFGGTFWLILIWVPSAWEWGDLNAQGADWGELIVFCRGVLGT
jgi:hypothetical protein